MTATERIHTSGPSDRSATRVNNIRVLKKQNGMDFSIIDHGELEETHRSYIRSLDTRDPSTLTSNIRNIEIHESLDKTVFGLIEIDKRLFISLLNYN